MTTEQLAALKSVAEKATQGSRKTFMQSGPLLLATPGGQRVYAVATPDKVDHEANAEHAAAFDPTTCLELLEEVERLTKDAAYLRDLIDDLTDMAKCHYDHNGHCQEHAWFKSDVKCPHARAQQLWDRDGKEIAINHD